MTRKPVVLLHLAAKRLAVLLLIVFVASCGKDQTPNAPTGTFSGSKSAPGLGPSSVVATQGVVALAPGVPLSSFLGAYSMTLVSDLTIPAAGPYDETTYYLVQTNNGSDFAITSFGSDVAYHTVHHTTWLPDDDLAFPDRDGLTFDDTDTWRNSSQYSTQPAIGQVGILTARMVSEGMGSIIALLDTGVQASHGLFQSPKMKFLSGGNYLTFPPTIGISEPVGNGLDEDGDGFEDDGVGHGTYVAGCIYTGARMAYVRVYKVLDAEGRGTTFGLAKAIKAAADANVHVINMSLGLNSDDRHVHHAIVKATGQGIAVVASAGNQNSDTPQYPAGYPEVISVAAVDREDVRYERSNYGDEVDLTAPGVDVVSAIPVGGPYAIARGTSAAAPFVSAAIAMVRARNGGTVSVAAATGIVLATAKNISDMNPGIPLGNGRVDFHAASQAFIVEPPEE